MILALSPHESVWLFMSPAAAGAAAVAMATDISRCCHRRLEDSKEVVR